MKKKQMLFKLINKSTKVKVVTIVVTCTVAVAGVSGCIYIYNKVDQDTMVTADEFKKIESDNEDIEQSENKVPEVDKKNLEMMEFKNQILQLKPDFKFDDLTGKSDDELYEYFRDTLDGLKMDAQSEADKKQEEKNKKKDEELAKAEQDIANASASDQSSSDGDFSNQSDETLQSTPQPTPQPVINKKYDISENTEQWWRNHGIDIQSIEPFTPFHDNYNGLWNMIVDVETYKSEELLKQYWDNLFEFVRKEYPDKQLAGSGGYFGKYNGQDMYQISVYNAER